MHDFLWETVCLLWWLIYKLNRQVKVRLQDSAKPLLRPGFHGYALIRLQSMPASSMSITDESCKSLTWIIFHQSIEGALYTIKKKPPTHGRGPRSMPNCVASVPIFQAVPPRPGS
jgi:hypothetical protein